MNVAEWILYAGAIAHIRTTGLEDKDPLRLKPEDDAALWIAAEGAERRGFRFVPGILVVDIPRRYNEGLAASREPVRARIQRSWSGRPRTR